MGVAAAGGGLQSAVAVPVCSLPTGRTLALASAGPASQHLIPGVHTAARRGYSLKHSSSAEGRVSKKIVETLMRNTAALVAEWLRRLTRNQMGSARTGSNPVQCEFF